MFPLLLAFTAAAQDAPDRQPPPASPDAPEPPEADDPPLALPVDQVHAPAPERAPAAEPEQPLAIPGHRAPPRSAAQLQALRQYQRERVSVNTEVNFRVSGPPASVGVGFGGPWHGMYWGMRVSNPYVYTSRTHATYQGTTRLDVDDFLGTVGAGDLRSNLERDILNANRATTTWNVLAGVGVATIVAGYMGMSEASHARDEDAYYRYSSVALGGTGLTSGGLIGSSGTSSRAFRLRRYPSESIGVTQAEELADTHNNQLRQQLGLTPEDVWGIESQERPQR